MKIKPNLYKGENKILENPREDIGHKYIGDTSNLIPGKSYTFSCKIKQIPGENKHETNSVHIAQGHNQRFKSYGGYYIKDISDGILEFTFNYIAESNSILCYTGVGNLAIKMGAEWSNIEIVEGDSKNPIFIPNKDNLEPSNQAVFVAGGYSRKCIHSKLKTSRNRPVIFGGGLC